MWRQVSAKGAFFHVYRLNYFSVVVIENASIACFGENITAEADNVLRVRKTTYHMKYYHASDKGHLGTSRVDRFR